jgi:hypothetical protein
MLMLLFNIVSQKVISHKEMDDLKAYIIETMCMLEMCFPPFLYARTANDRSRGSNSYIEPTILT